MNIETGNVCWILGCLHLCTGLITDYIYLHPTNNSALIDPGTRFSSTGLTIVSESNHRQLRCVWRCHQLQYFGQVIYSEANTCICSNYYTSLIAHSVIPPTIRPSLQTYQMSFDRTECLTSLLNGEGYYLPDSSFTASSFYNDGTCDPYMARLLDTEEAIAWCSGSTGNFGNEYLQVDFGTHRCIVKIVTRGRHNHSQFVDSYIIKYWDDTSSAWITITENGSVKIFAGPSNTDDIIVNPLPEEPVYTRKIRYYPMSAQYYPSSRFDVLGC